METQAIFAATTDHGLEGSVLAQSFASIPLSVQLTDTFVN